MTWGFLAKGNERDAVYEVGIRIGERQYDKARISNYFPLFIQLPMEDFMDLKKNGTIYDVTSLEDFVKLCHQNDRSNDSLDSIIEEDTSEDEDDLYNLGLDKWDKGECLTFRMAEVPIEEPLNEYAVCNVGISDIVINGRYDEKIFSKVHVSDGTYREDVVLGQQFLNYFTEFTWGRHEDLWPAAFGFVEDYS